MRKNYIIFSILLFFVSSSFSSAKVVDENKYSTINTTQMEEYIEKEMTNGKIPGMAVGIVQDGEIVYEKGFGYSNVSKKKLVTPETLFEIGSNSKAFTALAIMQLEKKGIISINDNISQYIPWLKFRYHDKTVDITIEQFLHQTSGIPFNSIDLIPPLEGENALEETVKKLINQPLDRMPGENFQYATINYDILGLLIEKVSGKSYEEYMIENIFKPMNLTQTYLYKQQIKEEDMAAGYKISFLSPKEYVAPRYDGNKPAGYIISNLKDMERWVNMQLGTVKETKIEKELISKTQEPNRKIELGSDGTFYASGWFVYQNEGLRYEHGGENPNFSSYIILQPDDKLGIVVLSNMNSTYTSMVAKNISKMIEGELTERTVKDRNQEVDIVVTIINICISFIVVIILVGLIKLLFLIKKGKTIHNGRSKKRIFITVISFVSCFLLCYAIYLIPNKVFYGLSWKFLFVWLPNSLKSLIELIGALILLAYIKLMSIIWIKKVEGEVEDGNNL